MMRKSNTKRILAVALSSLWLGTAAAHAATQDTTADPWFSKYDSNHDGFLSKSELRERSGYAKVFDEADDNHDGRLDRGEFVKAQSLYERQAVGTYVDDSVLTAKVKAALIKAMHSPEVGVETYHGQVLLSGFVEDEGRMHKALQIASSVSGVASVKNGMAVKKQ